MVGRLKAQPLNAQIYGEREDPDFERSIQTHGVLEPLVVTPKGVIISGVRRWKAARKLGLKTVPCMIREFEDEVLALVEYNRYRVKTPREIYNEYQIVKQREKPRAEERMRAGKHPVQPVGQGRVERIAAGQLGVSHEHLRQIDYVYGREERPGVKPIVESLDRGDISVRQAYEKVKRLEEPSAQGKKLKSWPNYAPYA
jgi:ParB-like chromosome segregation protein Spo0J